MTTTSESSLALRNFVNGAYADAADGRTSDLVDPTTGQAYATAPVSSAEDVDRAMQAAAAAFDSWRDTTPSERQKALIRIADAMEARADELVDVECRNTGKPRRLRSVLQSSTPICVCIFSTVSCFS